eukprot:Seg1077.16 transcript_id=Seg1077.16/GoldUCD/mRNA.D3Y31 product="RNA polymerase I-specific transcription initiation factor RRN3" protein_id=Seg1077.16/GoldUCD/D3Y31
MERGVGQKSKAALEKTDKIRASFANVLKEAILEKQAGERDRYNSVLKVLSEGKFSPESLLGYIEACRSCVGLLNREHETLVGAILKLDWTSASEDVVTSYINFLTELVSAHTFFLRSCFKMLLQKFMPNVKITDRLDELDLKDYEVQFENVHKAICAMTKIVPTAPRHLLVKLCDLFPYIGKHQVLLEAYIKNLLYLTKYLPSLQEKIFEIIIDNLLKIDVQICKKDIEEELDVDSDGEMDETQFEFEIEKEPQKSTEEVMEQNRKNNEMKNESGRKLDNLMSTIFEYVQKTCFHDDIVDWEKSENLYNDLVRVFEVVLLPTHASSYVQFIIFYICSFDQVDPLKFCAPSIVDMFARVTRMHEVVFCYTIIEHNKRSFLPTMFTNSVRDNKNMLDSFFPFDPYLLKKSSTYIKPIYQEWTGIESDDIEEDDEEEVIKDDNGNEDRLKAKQLEDAIMQFSISPGTPRFDLCVSPGFHPELMKNTPLNEE